MAPGSPNPTIWRGFVEVNNVYETIRQQHKNMQLKATLEGQHGTETVGQCKRGYHGLEEHLGERW